MKTKSYKEITKASEARIKKFMEFAAKLKDPALVRRIQAVAFGVCEGWYVITRDMGNDADVDRLYDLTRYWESAS